MKYEVDGWNNFCRVFELPEEYPTEFCFGGGHPVTFKIVDWFNPVPNIGQPVIDKEKWLEKVGEIEVTVIDLDEFSEKLIAWMLEKSYIVEGKQYLILCDFGASILFKK